MHTSLIIIHLLSMPELYLLESQVHIHIYTYIHLHIYTHIHTYTY